MKYIPLILLLLTTTPALSQDKHLTAGIGTGWMDGLATEVHLSYVNDRLSANAGFITPLLFERDDRQVVYFKPEFTFPVGIQGAIGVGAGYCMHIFKSGRYRDEQLTTGLTTTGILFSLRYLREVGNGTNVYGGVAVTRAVIAFTIGIKFKIIQL